MVGPPRASEKLRERGRESKVVVTIIINKCFYKKKSNKYKYLL
jgi:hypothetical protein